MPVKRRWMIESMSGWRPQLRFTFDHEYGPDMGSMVKMKG